MHEMSSRHAYGNVVQGFCSTAPLMQPSATDTVAVQSGDMDASKDANAFIHFWDWHCAYVCEEMDWLLLHSM